MNLIGEKEMSEKYILDDEGNPVECNDLMKWGRWFEMADNMRIVGKNFIGDVHVSTVFLGMDHNFGYGESREPILYETMIFGGKHNDYQERYATRAEAIEGHARALKMVMEEQ